MRPVLLETVMMKRVISFDTGEEHEATTNSTKPITDDGSIHVLSQGCIRYGDSRHDAASQAAFMLVNNRRRRCKMDRYH